MTSPALKTGARIPVRVTFRPHTFEKLCGSPEAEARLKEAIDLAVANVARSLRVKGKIAVAVEPGGCFAGFSGVGIWVNGVRVRFDDWLPLGIYHCLAGSPAASRLSAAELIEALTARLGFDLLPRLITEAVKFQPGVLLARENLAEYEALSALVSPPQKLWQLLRSLLDHGVAIPELEDIAAASEKTDTGPFETLFENLFSWLSSDRVEVRMASSYLRQLTMTELFPFLRDGLFEEIGIVFPQFRMTLDETLGPRNVEFRVNAVTSPRYVALEAGTCLVNEAYEALREKGYSAEPAWNPATRQVGAIASIADQQRLEAAGFRTWDPFGFIILCFAEVLRSRASWFVHLGMVRKLLEHIKRAYPAVTAASSSYLSEPALTRLLRDLVASDAPIPNLQAIFERIVDCEYAMIPSIKLSTFPNRIRDLRKPDGTLDWVTFIRMGLGREISSRHTRGSNTLVCYLLSQDLENLLLSSQPGPVSETETEALMEALYREIAALKTGTGIPAILTSAVVRPRVRSVLRYEFPKVPVLTYNDLAPDLFVQPVARLEIQQRKQAGG